MMSNIAVLKEDGLTSLCFQISTLGLKIVGRLFHSYNRPLSPQVPPPPYFYYHPLKNVVICFQRSIAGIVKH